MLQQASRLSPAAGGVVRPFFVLTCWALFERVYHGVVAMLQDVYSCGSVVTLLGQSCMVLQQERCWCRSCGVGVQNVTVTQVWCREHALCCEAALQSCCVPDPYETTLCETSPSWKHSDNNVTTVKQRRQLVVPD